jgi:hypothetical protein
MNWPTVRPSSLQYPVRKIPLLRSSAHRNSRLLSSIFRLRTGISLEGRKLDAILITPAHLRAFRLRALLNNQVELAWPVQTNLQHHLRNEFCCSRWLFTFNCLQVSGWIHTCRFVTFRTQLLWGATAPIACGIHAHGTVAYCPNHSNTRPSYVTTNTTETSRHT